MSFPSNLRPTKHCDHKFGSLVCGSKASIVLLHCSPFNRSAGLYCRLQQTQHSWFVLFFCFCRLRTSTFLLEESTSQLLFGKSELPQSLLLCLRPLLSHVGFLNTNTVKAINLLSRMTHTVSWVGSSYSGYTLDEGKNYSQKWHFIVDASH